MKNIIKKLWYKFMLWIEQNKMHQIDIDMMSSDMSYEEYIDKQQEIVNKCLDIQGKIEAIIQNKNL